MPRSTSGRVVVEIDPELKAELYSRLALERLTLREWLTREAAAYVRGARTVPPPPGREER